MARYLDPKNDLLFKKVFGEHKNLCISLLNSLLKFNGDAVISEIEYEAVDTVCEIPVLKDSVVDVRCKDKAGRKFIVEMQMNRTKDFQQRVLFDASKIYVRSLKQSEDFSLLQSVYSLNLVNDKFDSDRATADLYYHRYNIADTENAEKQIKGLQFIFIELPKYKPKTQGEPDYFDLWLRYLTEINKDSVDISPDFMKKKELAQAIECIEETALTPQERALYDKIEDAIRVRRALLNGALEKGREEGRLEGRERGRLEGRFEGRLEGRLEGKLEIAAEMKRGGMADEKIARFTGISLEEIRRCLSKGKK